MGSWSKSARIGLYKKRLKTLRKKLDACQKAARVDNHSLRYCPICSVARLFKVK